MISELLKVFLPALLSFLIGLAITPQLTRWMYRTRMWKRRARTDNFDAMSEDYKKLANDVQETSTPRLGGIVMWGAVALTALIIFLLSRLVPSDLLIELDFLSKSQTLIPFLALLAGAGYGMFEDILEIFHERFPRLAHGLDRRLTISMVLLIGGAFACWFFFKLDYRTVIVPIVGPVFIGWGFIPYFMLVILGTFSSRVIDGIDGLAGGVIGIIYGVFGVIGVIQGQLDIAALCFVIAGGVLAFLWFNVPPAQFYMGETGMMGLVLALPVIAFLLHRSLWIVIVGLPLAATAFSSFAQMASKKYLGKKVFRVAPLHHHFMAGGWSRPGTVMRYWIFTTMMGAVGVLLVLV